jgi:hypothetical protein
MWYFVGRERSEQASRPLSGERGEQMKLTRAVTHIRLCDANDTKVAALDAHELKAVLDARHQVWRHETGWS